MEYSKCENLVDYFFVCGLDYNVGLDTYELTSESDDLSGVICKPPLQRPYKATILQKFPDHCGNYAFPEDYSTTSLCMPDGLRLFTSSTVSFNPINHNFIMIREDASRIYGTALLFAEEIDNEDIKLAVKDLQNMYKIGHNAADGRHSCCNGCNTISPDTPNSSVRDSGSFSCSNTSLAALTNCSFWMENDKLYAMKAIGVLSQLSYTQCHQSWLYDIWLMISNENKMSLTREISIESSSDVDLDPNDIHLEPKINLESYVYNILFETDPPNRGRSIVFQGPSMKHFCLCPDSKDLPVFELPMRDLLEVLGLESLIRIYSCVLLEYRVVILSQDYRLLMLVAECITCLLFPFVWSHVYAPILPLAARHLLNAPVPFIMGIKLNSSDEEDAIQLPSDASVCYVNIDKQTVNSSDDIPSFPYEIDLRREITDLLVHSVDNGIMPMRPVGSRRSSFCPTGDINYERKSESDIKNNKNYLPPYKTKMNSTDNNIIPDENIHLDHLVDNNPDQFESRKRRKSSDPPTTIHDMQSHLMNSDGSMKSTELHTFYYKMLSFNSILRELFLNHFLHIFYDYEQFIIPPKSDMSSYLLERESTMQAFDKAGFLSEQPETHLPFLSAFLETQMFTSFIDMKMIATWEDPHPNLVLFERKLRYMRSKISKLNQTQNSEVMDFRPYRSYFSSASIMEKYEKVLKTKLEKAIKLEPKIVPHVLSCNDPDGGICQSQSRNQFHHHHKNQNDAQPINISFKCFSGTNFPWIQSDFLRTKPLKEPSVKNHEMKQQSMKTEPAKDDSINLTNNKMLYETKSSTMNTLSDVSESIKSRTMVHNGVFNQQKVNRVIIDPRPTYPNIDRDFVNTLLKECKSKTKRMVLEKMGGQEAIELGHLYVMGIEENTLVAGLCDLLERIWCHGLVNKYGKSALWTHLTKFVERDRKAYVIKRTNKENARRNSLTAAKNLSTTELVKDALTGVGIDSYCLFRYFNDSKGDLHHGDVFGSLKQMKISSAHQTERSPTPDFINKSSSNPGHGVSDLFFHWNHNLSGSLGRNSALSMNMGSSKNIDLESIFGPQRRSLVVDVNAIKSMTDIKTDVGLARAFVRLALEKKLLSEHLKKLLSDSILLKELYKRHAFLRCEEEREQFLFHLLALQAVEYYSFTNLYNKSQLLYRVFIYSGKRFSTGINTTANSWFCVNGQHCSTGQRAIPKGLNSFEFKNQNLGVLTSLRIGHDNSGISPKWYIDFVLIQNLITGLVYRFPCNNWLGKGVDDGSTERLLVAELIRINEDDMKSDQTQSTAGVLGFQTPPHSRSPSTSRRQSDGKILSEVPIIQEQLGNAVNNLVKYFYRRQERDKLFGSNFTGSSNVTFLLCGPDGLVPSMEKVFKFGFKSSRLFQKKSYIWDYLEKVAAGCSHDIQCVPKTDDESEMSRFTRQNYISIQPFIKLINKISNVNQSIGKDGKFQRFICLATRDHKLPEWIDLFGQVDCTAQYYDESCFFRDSQLREFLIKILSSLNEYIIPLERALTDGL